MPADLSLIINLSAGDSAYAHLTTAVLAKAHRLSAKEIIIIVDDTKAQYSNFYNHEERYEEPKFSENSETIVKLTEDLKQQKLVDSVIFLSHFTYKNLNKKYLSNRVKETHDFRGAPITAYLAGFEACKTQYLLRYDGDMILHQSKTDWALQGIELLQHFNDAIAVSPLPSPPLSPKNGNANFDPTYWFSTRCTLFDAFKVMKTLPLMEVKHYAEVLVRKWLHKTYPPAFETMLLHHFKKLGLKNYYLLNGSCWLLHPEEKNENFVRLLPQIISEVEKGNFPVAQADHERLDLEAWSNFLKLKKV